MSVDWSFMVNIKVGCVHEKIDAQNQFEVLLDFVSPYTVPVQTICLVLTSTQSSVLHDW